MRLIAVDKKDQFLKLVDKNTAHQGKGVLHRAFSVFIFNLKGELLLQRRSQNKKLWPLFWSNTCCSHPQKKTNIINQAERRLKEEMGFTTRLKIIDKFYYQASYKNGYSEHELSYILVGRYNGKVKPNPQEVAAVKWVNMDRLKKDFQLNPNQYTPWFKKMVKNNKLSARLFKEKVVAINKL